jgi:hypothetical protein
MRRSALVALLLVGLLGLVLLGGCLFGKKGEEGAKSETPTAGPADAKAAGPPGAGAAKGGPPAAGAPKGGPPTGAPAGPAGAPKGLGGPPLGAPAGLTKGPGGPPPAAEKAGPAAPGDARKALWVKRSGQYNQALQMIGGATTPDAQWLKGWILAEQGKKAEATTAFEAFVKAAKPGDSRVAQAKAALKRLKAAGPAAGGPPGGGMGAMPGGAGMKGGPGGPPGGMGMPKGAGGPK